MVVTGTVTPEPTHYVLRFDELPAKGIEVEVRAGTVRERLAFDRLRFGDAPSVEALMDREEKIVETLAARLVSWNIADKQGVLIAPSLDALYDLEDPVLQQIVEAWITTISPSGADDLGKDSTPGPNPMEASLPMESLSPSPSS